VPRPRNGRADRTQAPPEPHAELAVIHNELARAQYDMGIVALRLVMMLAEKVDYNDKELTSHCFKVADYAEQLGLRNKGGSAYAQLVEVCDQLLKTLVQTNRSFNEQVKFQVMRLAIYRRGEGEIELQFHEEMKPFLLSLREYFARIPLEVFFRIKGAYAARMYLVCKSWDPSDKRNRCPGWTWTVEQLRQWLALKPKEYAHTPHLKSAILDRAKKELDEVADVSFQYTTNKEGKSIVGWNFVPVVSTPKQKPKRPRVTDVAPTEEPPPKPDFAPMARLWAEATELQRMVWFEDDLLRQTAPKNGEPPRPIFLARLHSLTQPTEAGTI